MKKKNYLYYWANNENLKSGEGILCNKFLDLLKTKYPKNKFINLNNFKLKENLFYNYFTPLIGILKIWFFYKRGFKVCYINYLPIWNFIIFFLLPKEAILGPITGTLSKQNYIYNSLIKITLIILKFKWKKLLFSHDLFKKNLKNMKKNIFYNFLFYNFKIEKINTKFKKYDLVFYYRNNPNKGNTFYISLLKKLSNNYKIAIIGDKLDSISNTNIENFTWVKRQFAKKIISSSRFGILSKENIFGFFALDCLSFGVPIFYNDKLKISNNFINENILLPISYSRIEYSLKIINKSLNDKIKNKKFKFKKVNFKKYLD